MQLDDSIHLSFSECSLDYANFVGMKLKKTVFSNCSLREADFSQADFSESDFRKSDFFSSRFHGTNLQRADFRGAKSYLIDPTDNSVRGAKFSLPEAQGLLSGLGVILD